MWTCNRLDLQTLGSMSTSGYAQKSPRSPSGNMHEHQLIGCRWEGVHDMALNQLTLIIYSYLMMFIANLPCLLLGAYIFEVMLCYFILFYLITSSCCKTHTCFLTWYSNIYILCHSMTTIKKIISKAFIYRNTM